MGALDPDILEHRDDVGSTFGDPIRGGIVRLGALAVTAQIHEDGLESRGELPKPTVVGPGLEVGAEPVSQDQRLARSMDLVADADVSVVGVVLHATSVPVPRTRMQPLPADGAYRLLTVCRPQEVPAPRRNPARGRQQKRHVTF